MKLNILIKLREIGNITAEFIGSTKDHIFLKNAVINKSSVVIDTIKINKKYIIHLTSDTKIDLSIFRKIELNALKKLNSINNDEVTAALKKKEDEEIKEKDKKPIIEDDIKIKSEKKSNNGRKFKKDTKEINQLDDRIIIKNDIDITSELKKNKNDVLNNEINNSQKGEERIMSKKVSDNDESYSPSKNIKKDLNSENKNEENNKNEISKKLDDLKINNRKSIIDEELKKEEKRVTSLIENSCDPLNMWSSVSKILVKKNELAGKINGRNDEIIKSTDEIKESNEEIIKSFNKKEKKEGEEKNGKNYMNINNKSRIIKNNSLKEEIDTNVQNEIGGRFEGGYKNNKGYYRNKNIDGINDFKSSEKVISTPSLQYEKAADIKQNIVKKFNKFNKNNELLKWSKIETTIEEKIKQIEKQNCIFPNKKKIDEIVEFGILSQQKANIFKKN